MPESIGESKKEVVKEDVSESAPSLTPIVKLGGNPSKRGYEGVGNCDPKLEGTLKTVL